MTTLAVSEHQLYEQRRLEMRTAIINEFVEEVERRAEKKMMMTHKLEGAHYAAMKELQKEWNAKIV